MHGRRGWKRVKPAKPVYHEGMTTEERITRCEENVARLAAVQDQMMDVLGLSLEGERRIATRVERIEESFQESQERMARVEQARLEFHQEFEEGMAKLRETVQEIGDKLNGLIGVVDGFIRGKQ